MHRIRLRGPWEVHCQGQTFPLELPCNWQALIELTGSCPFELTRRFGQPTGIGRVDAVWLAIEAGPIEFSVRLNGVELGYVAAADAARFAVTERLQARNELRLAGVFQRGCTAAESISNLLEVQLEIAHADPAAS